MLLVRPRVIPEVAVAPAHRKFRNNNTEAAFIVRGHQCVDPAIRLTINEIIKVAALAFMPSLIENPAALKMLRQETSQFAVCGFAKFPFFDIATDDDVGSQS